VPTSCSCRMQAQGQKRCRGQPLKAVHDV
jgi:hypothetical protein